MSEVEISPQSRDDARRSFQQLLWRLFQQVLWGKARLDIGKGLALAMKEDPVLNGISPVFFAAVLDSFADTAHLYAARLFDTTRGTETIMWMLGKAERTAGLFRTDAENVRKAVADAKSKIMLLEKELEALRQRRNKILAHSDLQAAVDPRELAERATLTLGDLEHILETAAVVLNEIAILHHGIETYPSIMQWDDYKQTLEFMAKGQCADIHKHEAAFGRWPGPRPKECL